MKHLITQPIIDSSTRRVAIVLAAAALLLIVGGPVDSVRANDGGDFEDFSELNLEDLLDQVMTTGARHAQKISESPVAATVITAEQIAVSGATTIPELLRVVPGLDVMVPTASHFDVSARGLNELGTNATLVLVDGRSVYADFYGLTLWDFLPVALDEIKAIEVIKGPGSAFYGANAFACVINIITWEPDEIEGTLVRTATSSYGDGLGSVVHGGTRDRWGWRLSTSLRRTSDWEADKRESDMARANAQANWRPSAQTRVSLSAGLSEGQIFFIPSTESLVLDGRTQYLRADYTWRDLQMRGFWNHWGLRVLPSSDAAMIDLTSVFDADVYDLELRHVLRPGGGHFLQWGGEFRHKVSDWTDQGQPIAETIYSAFAYDEWRLSECLLLSVGLRYDDHPLVGGHLAPRGGLVFRPSERHALRATSGVAYRDPTYMETYWYTEVDGFMGLSTILRGDLDLVSEQIRSIEVGYQGLLGDDLLVGVSAFRNEVRDLIDLNVIETVPSPPAPVEGIPSELAFINDDNWNMLGGELSVESRLAGWLQARAHWAYLWAEKASDGEPVATTPRHIAAVALAFTPHPQHDAELRARYRGRTTWSLGFLSGPSGSGESDEIFVVDARWHLKLKGGASRAVIGVENVFDQRHRDHPLAIRQQRRLSASLMVRF